MRTCFFVPVCYNEKKGKVSDMNDANSTSINSLLTALKKNHYEASFFPSLAQAREYLAKQIRNHTVGFGDSQTLAKMKLEAALSSENTIYNPGTATDNDTFLQIAGQCLTAEIFLTSVNAVTTDGVLVNMDGTGNRVAGSLFGHSKVYFIIGQNKIVPDIDSAIKRIQTTAAPQNAKRLNLRTPCAKTGICMNCSSPDRICNCLTIYLKKMNDTEAEVVLVGESAGF